MRAKRKIAVGSITTFEIINMSILTVYPFSRHDTTSFRYPIAYLRPTELPTPGGYFTITNSSQTGKSGGGTPELVGN